MRGSSGSPLRMPIATPLVMRTRRRPPPRCRCASSAALLVSEYEQRAKVFKPEYPEMQELKARIGALELEHCLGIGGDHRWPPGGPAMPHTSPRGRTKTRSPRALNATKSEVQGERGSSIQYNILKREVDTNRQLYDGLLQRYKEVGVAGQVSRNNISIDRPAEAPRSPKFKPEPAPRNLFPGRVAGPPRPVGSIADRVPCAISWWTTPSSRRRTSEQRLRAAGPRA